MARTDTGRWVARAAATGGGRTYRGRRPLRWYTSLALIVLLYLVPRYFECLCYKHASLQERQRSKMRFWKLFLYTPGADPFQGDMNPTNPVVDRMRPGTPGLIPEAL